MAKKLFVRYSKPADEKKIFDYYQNNEHQYVVARDPDVWRERIASGAVTIIEDENGKIVASSISYPHISKNAKGEDVHKWTEIGSTRVAKEGLGLFNVLISAQIMRAYFFEPPEDRFVIEIEPNNKHSKHVFNKAGAVPYAIPKELYDKINATIAPEDKDSPADWFQMGCENMPAIAKMLSDAVKNPKLVDKKTGEEYEFDFSGCVIVQSFRKELDTLAGSNYGDRTKPDPQKGLKHFNNKPGR